MSYSTAAAYGNVACWFSHVQHYKAGNRVWDWGNTMNLAQLCDDILTVFFLVCCLLEKLSWKCWVHTQQDHTYRCTMQASKKQYTECTVRAMSSIISGKHLNAGFLYTNILGVYTSTNTPFSFKPFYMPVGNYCLKCFLINALNILLFFYFVCVQHQ